MNITVPSHRIYKPNLIYLIYKRLRPAFGFLIGSILMYGAYTGNVTSMLLVVCFGFVCIHLFGDCYNDCQDFEEDLKNERTDKMTISGMLSAKDMRNLSFLLLILGLIALGFTNLLLLALGCYYAILLWAYSTPLIRLKKYNVFGYAIVGSTFLFLPLFLNFLFHGIYLIEDTIVFSIFCFTQYTYILCQKDSTDIKDETNLFLARGWKKASLICILSASLAVIFLLKLILFCPLLLLVWIFNLISKVLNLSAIYNKKICRDLRGKLITMEFLTPYLYFLVITL